MKKTLTFVLVVSILFPIVVSAAWWNPTTWKIWQIFTKPNVETQIVEIEEEEESEKVAQEVEPIVNSTPSTPSPVAPSVSTPPVQRTLNPVPVSVPSQPSTSSARFQIFDVSENIEEYQVTVSWNTTLPSRSRLMLGGRVYESLNGVGTQHRVLIDTRLNSEYNYHITARTLDERNLEDDLYGAFLTPSSANNEVIATLGEMRGECRLIVVRDTRGWPVVDMKITVRGIWQGNGYFQYRPQVVTSTNTRGEIEYCYPTTKYEVSGDNLWVELYSTAPNSIIVPPASNLPNSGSGVLIPGFY